MKVVVAKKNDYKIYVKNRVYQLLDFGSIKKCLKMY